MLEIVIYVGRKIVVTAGMTRKILPIVGEAQIRGWAWRRATVCNRALSWTSYLIPLSDEVQAWYDSLESIAP